MPWPTSWRRWKDDTRPVFEDAPFVTWLNAWYNAPCLFWPAPARQPLTIDGQAVGGVLLISETLDARTPFEGSLEVRRRYPRASLIGVSSGTRHAGSLSGNACVDDLIAAYLATGALPPRSEGDGADDVATAQMTRWSRRLWGTLVRR